MRHDLKNCDGFDAASLFSQVDDCGSNYIDAVNLKRYLMSHSYMPNDNLLLAVIRRMDLDSDAKLNFNEFTEIITPLER